MRNKFVWLLAALLCLPLAVLPTSASASSVYDEAYITTDTLWLGDDNFYGINCPFQDVSYNIEDILGQESNWQSSTNYTNYWPSFDEAKDNGSWALSQYRHLAGGGENRQVMVTYSETPGDLAWAGPYSVRTTATELITLVVTTRQHHFGYGGCVPFVVSSVASASDIAWDAIHAPQYLENYFAAGWDVDYPVDYEGDLIRESRPAAKYVAMGDSFSSGEGNLPYEYGSDTMANTCHRSSTAYPRLVQNERNLGATAFVACSGAVSDYIINDYNQENVEMPQALYVTDDTEVVTITIGGNDVGFGETLTACTASTIAQDCLDAVATASTKIADPSFAEDIEDALTGIKSLGGNDTQVILVGYPNIFASYGDISGSCTWGSYALSLISGQVSARTITEDEVNAFREVHDDLSDVLLDAVANTLDEDIHFVDPSAQFAGHELCGPLSPKLNEVYLHLSTADISIGSFHPNSAGQEAYALAIATKLNSLN